MQLKQIGLDKDFFGETDTHRLQSLTKTRSVIKYSVVCSPGTPPNQVTVALQQPLSATKRKELLFQLQHDAACLCQPPRALHFRLRIWSRACARGRPSLYTSND